MQKGLQGFLVFPFVTIIQVVGTILLFPINWFLILTNQPGIGFVIPFEY